MPFSMNIKNMRKIHGQTQEELANMLDVTRQAVSKWEVGDAYPDMDRMIMLAGIWNCSIDKIFEEEIEAKCVKNQDSRQKCEIEDTEQMRELFLRNFPEKQRVVQGRVR